MSGRKISFEGWTLDRESGELTRNGVARQRLQELPLKVLDLLIADPGAVVSREQLIAHLWPNGVVEYDTGLNTAIRKLRLALGDVADIPRYIETLPRRGYRFIGTIDRTSERTAAVQSEVVDSVVVADAPVIPAPGVSGAMPSTAAAPNSRSLEHVPVRLLVAILGGIPLIVITAAMLYGRLHRTAVLATAHPDQASVVLPGRTAAVLPFANLSPAADNGILALGMAEAVLHRLGAMKDLTVISRTSSFVFNDYKADVRDIGQKLNARYIVEGSVQRAGERLRVTAELIDATSGARRWSLSFDRQLADIFALEDEISANIADALSVSVLTDHGADSTERTSRVDAYMAYMEGRSLINTSKVASCGSPAKGAMFMPSTEQFDQIWGSYHEKKSGMVFARFNAVDGCRLVAGQGRRNAAGGRRPRANVAEVTTDQ